MEDINKIIKLVAKINLREKGAINKFNEWKNKDGSIKGLLENFPYLNNESESTNE